MRTSHPEVSAGFDAAKGDDLGECLVSPEGYAHMTHMLASLASGRLVVALEVALFRIFEKHLLNFTFQGGYNLDASAASAVAVTRVLLGEPPDELPPMVASEVGTETVWLVCKEQRKYWKNVDPKSCEPRDGVYCRFLAVASLIKLF